MATTTIPWGDGSGDNIYLTYSSASGDQTVEVSSDANTGGARTKVVTFTAGNVSQTLTINQERGPQQYTLTKYPSSIDTVNTVVYYWDSSYPQSNGYTSATSSSEARSYLVLGSQAETFVYWKFDLSSIPDNAVIDSVGLKVKAMSQSASITPTSYLVVCDGTTQKGSVSNTTSSLQTYTVDTGSGWTGTSIKNLSLLFYSKRGTGSVNSNRALRFFGATLTIKYTV